MESADILEVTKLLNRRNTAKKTIQELEINGNRPAATAKGLPSKKSSIDLKKHQLKPSLINQLAQMKFYIECLICNVVVLCVAPYIFPFLLIFFILKKLEQFVEYRRHKSIPMAGEDALWLQDSEKNRLVISSVMLIDRREGDDPQKAIQDFRDVVKRKLVDSINSKGELMFPRARQRIQAGYFQYFFQEAPDFDIHDHVFEYKGDPPKSKEELEAILSKMYSEPMPEGKPPWFFCCMATEFGERKIASIFRLNHCMADGVSLSRWLTRVLPDHYIPQKEARKFTSVERGLMTAKAYFIMVRVLVGLLLRFPDRSVLHKGQELSGKKSCVWSKPFDLDLVKKIKNATGTTVNDVLMSCLTLAIRRYLQQKGNPTPSDFTASIPVDVGLPTEEVVFQNKFAVVFLKLPVNTDGVLNILYETKRRMDILKMSGEPIAMATIMNTSVDLLPEFLTKPLGNFISNKASCVLSNVPGPQYHLVVNGNPVKFMMFWPPQRSNMGMGLAIYSYANDVIVSVEGDLELMKDPDMMTELFGKALQEMAGSVLGIRDGQTIY